MLGHYTTAPRRAPTGTHVEVSRLVTMLSTMILAVTATHQDTRSRERVTRPDGRGPCRHVANAIPRWNPRTIAGRPCGSHHELGLDPAPYELAPTYGWSRPSVPSRSDLACRCWDRTDDQESLMRLYDRGIHRIIRLIEVRPPESSTSRRTPGCPSIVQRAMIPAS